MSLMLSAVHAGTPSFWRLQAVAWTLTYVLLLLAALPHLTERDIFRYNTVGCAVLFCLTLGIRPLSRALSTRWRYSWLALQACALVLSLFLGMFASFAIGLGTFGWARLNGSNWMLSWLQCGAVIFLWCNLYISIKQWRLPADSISATSAIQQVAQEYATQFAIKAGSRIQVVPEGKVLWVSAARDYAELHTSSGTFLLRETMQSLEQRLGSFSIRANSSVANSALGPDHGIDQAGRRRVSGQTPRWHSASLKPHVCTDTRRLDTLRSP